MKVEHKKGARRKWRWSVRDGDNYRAGGPPHGFDSESDSEEDWDDFCQGMTVNLRRRLVELGRTLEEAQAKTIEVVTKLGLERNLRECLEAENKRIHWNTLIISIAAAISGGIIGFIIYPLV